jgi:hypothetical protein
MKTMVGARFAVAGANLKFAACKVLEPPPSSSLRWFCAYGRRGFVHHTGSGLWSDDYRLSRLIIWSIIARGKGFDEVQLRDCA